jgi:hypothetical protein
MSSLIQSDPEGDVTGLVLNDFHSQYAGCLPELISQTSDVVSATGFKWNLVFQQGWLVNGRDTDWLN